MIQCIFTIDYEIYGNGEGSLEKLVYEPAEKLKNVFLGKKERFVVFAEVAELEMIDSKATDPAIDLVKHQLRSFYLQKFEIALHLHPQWYRAQYTEKKWHLDYTEYNLCTLPRERIVKIVDQAIDYLKEVLDKPGFNPFSFRAGNWLFQPTQTVASILSDRGVKIDSSVFKGGLQHWQNLDYRPALKNGYFWRFMDDVNLPDHKGGMLEIPIYTQMVPAWKMVTAKRIDLQQKATATTNSSKITSLTNRLSRFRDYARLYYPLKFDFCRMTIDELTRMVEMVIKEDQKDPTKFRPLVAIGHTKDLVDFETVESFLAYLRERGIRISTLEQAYRWCN